MTKPRQNKIREIVGILLIFIPALLFGCLSSEDHEMLKREQKPHLRIHKEVKEKMGFDIRSDYRGKITGTMMFIDLDPNKAMFKGGAREEDLIRLSEGEFYELIVFNQGKEIAVPIKRDSKKLNIKVKVPYLDLQDDPSELHWYFRKHEESSLNQSLQLTSPALRASAA